MQIDLSSNALQAIPAPTFASMPKLKDASFANNLLTVPSLDPKP